MDPKQTPGRDSKGEPKPEAKVDVKGDGAEAKPSAKAEAKPRPKIVFKNPAQADHVAAEKLDHLLDGGGADWRGYLLR